MDSIEYALIVKKNKCINNAPFEKDVELLTDMQRIFAFPDQTNTFYLGLNKLPGKDRLSYIEALTFFN